MDFKEQCVALRKEDRTLKEIMDITGRPKTSVYFHIRGIPLSGLKQKKIRMQAGKRALHIARKRKGKSLRPFKEFSGWDDHTVCLISHLLFDGEIRLSGCVYHNRSKFLVSKVAEKMRHLYDFPPKRNVNAQTGVIRISYYNVALAHYVRQKADALLKAICGLPRECRREFLMAFYDDEGCIDFKPNRGLRRVRGYQKDTRILTIVQQLLGDFGIRARIQPPNEVVVSGRENLMRFNKEIGFSPGVAINGKRVNSVWKRNKDKRKILEDAVASYCR